MMKFTYGNEYTVVGKLVDENELTYTVEFEAAEGFKDTVTFEKELTVLEEVKDLEVIFDDVRGIHYEGLVVKGKKYEYIVMQSKLSEKTIEVKRILEYQKGKKTSVMYWDIDKYNLKGSGGLGKKVLEVVKSLV